MFDVGLDVGTAAAGGGDVEYLHRLVASGHLLRYEPEALVWHLHRREFSELERQIFNNGCSVAPYLLTCLRNGTASPGEALRYAASDILGWWILRRLLRPGKHKRRLVFRELAGFLRGVLAYPEARRTAARLSASAEVACSQEAPTANAIMGKCAAPITHRPMPVENRSALEGGAESVRCDSERP
jgi:O-antigen biosynthesis protein